MPRKTYDQLGLSSQQVIDAAIYMSEAFRIVGGINRDDGRDIFFFDQKAMVNYLRTLYAEDIQTNPPRYFDWHDQGAKIVKYAMEIQQSHTPDDGVSSNSLHEISDGEKLTQLLEHLDNMPYPEQGKRSDLSR